MLDLDLIPLRTFLNRLPVCCVCNTNMFLSVRQISPETTTEELRTNTLMSTLDYMDEDYNIYMFESEECRDLFNMTPYSYKPVGNLRHLVGGEYDNLDPDKLS